MITDEHGIRQRAQSGTSATLARAWEAYTGHPIGDGGTLVLATIGEVIDEYHYQGERWGWEHDAQHTESDWDDLTVALRGELAGALFEMALARAIAQQPDNQYLRDGSVDADKPRAYWAARARHAAICLAATCATLVAHLDAGNVGQTP